MAEKIINSANVEKISWENKTLRIYLTTGQIQAYKEVPEGIYAALCETAYVGSFLRLYVHKEYKYTIEKESDLYAKLKRLEHHKDTTVGLWATDKPELIPQEIKDLFFKITFVDRDSVFS